MGSDDESKEEDNSRIRATSEVQPRSPLNRRDNETSSSLVAGIASSKHLQSEVIV